MKIKVEIDCQIEEDEVIIRCREFTDKIARLQTVLSDSMGTMRTLTVSQKDKQFYLPIESILFMETDNGAIAVHTKDNVFYTDYKLYELEQILPRYFTRVSKSSILNVKKIYSITKNISSSSVVEFQNSYKKVLVSRNYFKMLKHLLETRERQD